MNKSKNQVNVLLVQYNPQFKKISQNIEYLTKLLSKYSKEDKIDIIVFPEMTLSGYIFDSAEDILPYTSYNDSGEAYDFCTSLAK